MPSTDITDLQYYLDENGEIDAQMPKENRQLASFIALLVDEVSDVDTSHANKLTLRCKTVGCNGTISAAIDDSKEIVWLCPKCGHNGVVQNWSNTKWDRSRI